MSLEAVTCTVELSTGSLIEVAITPGDVIAKRQQFFELSDRGLTSPNSQDFLALPLLTGTSRSDADYRQEVFVDPHSIVAIYPLDERPIPPRRVYVDRIEAHDKT